jgi:hypothetical protein
LERCFRSIAGIIAFVGFSVTSSAATVIFQEGVSPTAVYGHLGQDIRGSGAINTASDMLIGYQSGGVLQIRSVLAFDLSSIPAGSTLDSITLTLTVNNTGNGTISGLGAIEIHEIIPNGVAANNMVENQVSFSLWKTGSSWTTAGGDFGGVLASAVVIDGDADNSFDNGEKATFASSAAWLVAAQSAFDTGQPLELILFSPTAEGTTGASNFARFGSDGAGTAANRPQLTINYTPVPEPSSAALLGFTSVALLTRRLRRSASSRG